MPPGRVDLAVGQEPSPERRAQILVHFRAKLDPEQPDPEQPLRITRAEGREIVRLLKRRLHAARRRELARRRADLDRRCDLLIAKIGPERADRVLAEFHARPRQRIRRAEMERAARDMGRCIDEAKRQAPDAPWLLRAQEDLAYHRAELRSAAPRRSAAASRASRAPRPAPARTRGSSRRSTRASASSSASSDDPGGGEPPGLVHLHPPRAEGEDAAERRRRRWRRNKADERARRRADADEDTRPFQRLGVEALCHCPSPVTERDPEGDRTCVLCGKWRTIPTGRVNGADSERAELISLIVGDHRPARRRSA